MPNFNDLTGRTFGRLTAIRRVPGLNARRSVVWECRCECGTITFPEAYSLTKGKTQSCGCLHRERLTASHTKHGHAGRGTETPEYNIWSDMIQRCHCPTNKAFANYGGRGIAVCDRWRESFVAFFEDMGPRGEKYMTIERIDNEKGYEPGNCRWATRAEQAKNRRTNRFITHDGLTLHISEWARRTGHSVPCLLKRLRTGRPTAEVLSKDRLPPRRVYGRKVKGR